MKLTEAFAVSPGKVAELFSRLDRLGVRADLIEESFIKGGGPGGQKVNKTANCVRLYYPPMGLGVRAGADRKRSVNRFLALRELADRIEMRLSPGTSARLSKIERLRRKKARRRNRTKRRLRDGIAAPGDGA